MKPKGSGLILSLCCAALLVTGAAAVDETADAPETAQQRSLTDETAQSNLLLHQTVSLVFREVATNTASGSRLNAAAPAALLPAALSLSDGLTPGIHECDGALYHVGADGLIDTYEEGWQKIDGALYRVWVPGAAITRYPAGLYLMEDGFYRVARDGGPFLTNTDHEGLHFDQNGRSSFTTGDPATDAMLYDALRACITQGADREEMLRAFYLYERDNYVYLSRPHHPRGSVDWVPESASFFLANHQGNCYCYAAAFYYAARALGYDATPISGGVGYANDDHAFVLINWPDGVTYNFDPGLGYSYHQKGSSLTFWKMAPSAYPFLYFFPNT